MAEVKPPTAYPIQSIAIHARKFNSKYYFPPHSLSVHQFYAVLDGKIRHCVGDQTHLLHAGDALLIAPGLLRSPKAASTTGLYLVVHFVSPWNELGVHNGMKFVLDQDTQSDAKDLCNLTPEASRGHIASILFHHLCLKMLGSQSFVFPNTTSGKRLSTPEHHKQLLQRVEAVMASNLSNRLQLSQIASLAGISRSTMDRLFRNAYSESPCARYRELRLLQARELLQKGKQTITEIAMQTGFASSQHFSSHIRKRFKTTPSQMRQL